MEPHAPIFPSFIAPLSDLYGAKNYRVAEAHAYATDLDDLDREELALERTVRALVDRKAPPPIGLNFHRTHASGTAAPGIMPNHPTRRMPHGNSVGLEVGSRPSDMRSGYHGHVAADDAEEDDDEEEEDMEEEEDEMDELEEEEEDDGLRTAEDDDDELFGDDDDEEDPLDEEEERAQSDSMDMSM